MKPALTDPLSLLAALSALGMFIALAVFAVRPALMVDVYEAEELSFSKQMRSESNGETGRGYEDDARHDI